MNVQRRIERLEAIVKPAQDWRAYCAAHGISEREVAEELLRMIQKGDLDHYGVEVIAEVRQIIESILGASDGYN